MAKKTKTAEKEAKNASDEPAAAEPKSNGSAPRQTRASAKKKATNPKKAGPAKASSSRQKRAPGGAEPTDEEIRIRAYFISERRQRLALPGDSSSDWLEAKRQLLSEARPR